MRKLYSTITDYINEVVVPSLGEHADDHDVAAIAAEMTEWHNEIDANGNVNLNKSGLIERNDVDFWDIATDHAYDA